jgi:uncharacterized membrane protein YsdA (DUF1294 family)
MRALWYLLTLVFGLFGALAGLRAVEHAISGGSIMAQQILIAVIALLIAAVCFKKVRGAAAQS